jgi:hypothetical protein
MSTELTIISIQNPLQVFSTPNGLDSIIDKIEADAKSIDRDISTEAGRDNIRSLAFKLAKSKTFLDKMGKDLTEEQRAQIAVVNAERKRAWERMEALQEEIRKPLTEWENRDKLRIQAHEDALLKIVDNALFMHGLSGIFYNPDSGTIKYRINKIPELMNREWEEFSARAIQKADETRLKLDSLYDDVLKKEADAAELARLRAEEEARQRREHDERVAAEATRAAEEKAARDAEIERQRVEKELHDAADRQRQIEEKALRDKADAEAALAAAEKKAADDAAAAAKALKDAQEKAERDKQAALKKQQDDAAAAKAAEDAATRKREADQAHKKKINNEAMTCIQAVIDEATRQGEDPAKMIIIAIAKGVINHVKISY